MRFKVKTLVDVTETNAPRGTDDLLVKQQQNFNTFYNVIGLRTNPTEFEQKNSKLDISKLGFGKNYKGTHRVWEIDFLVEAEGSTNIKLMEEDFDLIPILGNLQETIKNCKMFITRSDSQNTNIIFEQIDK
jgi:hypothetical protein